MAKDIYWYVLNIKSTRYCPFTKKKMGQPSLEFFHQPSPIGSYELSPYYLTTPILIFKAFSLSTIMIILVGKNPATNKIK